MNCKQRGGLLVLFLLLIPLFSFALPVENSRPIIEVSYDEDIFLLSASLEDTFGHFYALSNRTINATTLEFQPLNHLDNGNYYFHITVQDSVRNEKQSLQQFEVQVPFMSAVLVNPLYNVSPTQQFDLTIRTSKLAEGCKYQLNTQNGYDSIPSQFRLNSTDGYTHVFRNFVQATTNYLPVYIFCKESETQRTNSATPYRFDIKYDTSAPILDISAYPTQVISFNYFNLTVRSSDDIRCSYRREYSTGLGPVQYFEGYLQEQFSKIVSVQVIVEDDLDPQTVTYQVTCQNRAQLVTTQPFSILVDYTLANRIYNMSPSGAIFENTPQLSFNTNRPASCVLHQGSDRQMDYAGGQQIHFIDSTLLQQGQNTIDVTCTFYGGPVTESPIQQAQFDFIVDRTPPSLPSIDYEPVLCSNETTGTITFSATDAHSSVVGYNYSLQTRTGALVYGWKYTTSDHVTINKDNDKNDLELELGESYYVRVRAVDAAGNGNGNGGLSVSENSTSPPLKYLPQDNYCKEKNPPRVTVFVNETITPITAYLICEDESGCNDNTLKYGTITQLNDVEDCEAYRPYNDNLGISLFQDTYVCYYVEDVNGNNRTGGRLLTYPQNNPLVLCTNGIKDIYESDVDCGGSCPKCTEGQACATNSDCNAVAGLFCNTESFTCDVATCTDGIRNGGESAVDCGGSCEGCALGMTCRVASDCAEGVCSTNKVCIGEEDRTQATDIPQEWSEQYGCCLNPSGDDDNDGLKNLDEYRLNSNPTVKDTDGDGWYDVEEYLAGSDPTDKNDVPKDSDNDGIPDFFEIKYGLNPQSDTDASEDADNDGLSNKDEYLQIRRFGAFTDPTKADTDGDGVSDLKEINKGTNPVNPLSYPEGGLMSSLYWMLLAVVLVLVGLFAFMYVQQQKEKEKNKKKQQSGQGQTQAHTPSFLENKNIPESIRRAATKIHDLIEHTQHRKPVSNPINFDEFSKQNAFEKLVGKPKSKPVERKIQTLDDVLENSGYDGYPLLKKKIASRSLTKDELSLLDDLLEGKNLDIQDPKTVDQLRTIYDSRSTIDGLKDVYESKDHKSVIDKIAELAQGVSEKKLDDYVKEYQPNRIHDTEYETTLDSVSSIDDFSKLDALKKESKGIDSELDTLINTKKPKNTVVDDLKQIVDDDTKVNSSTSVKKKKVKKRAKK